MTTLCDTCDGVTESTRKLSPWRWTCIYFPNVVGPGYVKTDIWVQAEPHMYCRNINGGKCPLWNERKEVADA